MPIPDPEHQRKDRRKLRSLLIYPKFQLPLIGVNMAISGFSFLVVWTTGMGALKSLEPAAGLSGIEVDVYQKIFTYHTDKFDFYILMAAIAAMTLSGLFTLILSHKIAGPMVTLRRFLRDVKAGKETGELHFRNMDYLMDIPLLVNDAISALKDREKEEASDPPHKASSSG